MPLTPEAFLDHIKNTTKQTREILMNDWLEECADMIDDERDEIERWMPENQVNLMVKCRLVYNQFVSDPIGLFSYGLYPARPLSTWFEIIILSTYHLV